MFGSRSRPINEYPPQQLRNTCIVFPIIGIPLAVFFGYGAFANGWNWKGIVCGLASWWMLTMTILVIRGARNELKRRKALQQTDSKS